MYLAYTQDFDPPTNVRSGPGTNFEKLGKLNNNTVIIIIEKTDNKWLTISQPIAGYISANLVRTNIPPIYREEVGSIAVWQHLLNGCGYHPDNAPKLKITGDFDADTIAVTKKFQQDQGLPQTGDVSDLRTWQAAFDHKKIADWLPAIPNENLIDPPADVLSESDKYDYCRNIIKRQGGSFFVENSRRNLISFRSENSTKVNQWKGIYDDWTYLVWKNSNGQKKCQKYKSNTDPSSRYEDSSDPRADGPTMGQDADHDGIRDLGRLQEGYYEYQVGFSDKYGPQNNIGNVLKPTKEAQTVIRDVDHDGIFEANEPLLGANDMFFHTGSSTRTLSAGCQTMPPDEYKRFWNELTTNGTYNPGVIGYTLVRWKLLSQA